MMDKVAYDQGALVGPAAAHYILVQVESHTKN